MATVEVVAEPVESTDLREAVIVRAIEYVRARKGDRTWSEKRLRGAVRELLVAQPVAYGGKGL